ncbi:MAG: PilZ domain-containing protein [Planctomycetes bacterium]|nr:PilZ domain-containing protein [Planctomycetota bacterium]
MAFDKEQREEERFPVNAGSACVLAAPVSEDFGPVRVKNLSNKGIGLITSKKVEVGALLAVKLANAARKVTKTLLVRVTHATPQAGGSYLIGGTLDPPLTYEELTVFVM